MITKRLVALLRRSGLIPVVWGGLVNTTTSGAGELTKSAGGAALNGLAYSSQSFSSNGSVSFVLVDNSGGIFGLTSTGTPTAGAYSEITFGFGVPNTGLNQVKVYEAGVDKGQAQNNNGTTDIFTVTVTNNTVTYQKNGTTYYTSLTSASGLTLKPCADPYSQTQAIVRSTVVT